MEDKTTKQPEKSNETVKKENSKFGNGRENNKRKGGRFRKEPREKPEFDQQLVDLARVTRVTKGGKQLSFRALVVIGDKKGRVSYGLAKGKDVTLAVGKAVDSAKKIMIKVELTDTKTIAHEVRHKFGAAKIMLKPAPEGTGVKAGGALRTVLDMAGVENVVGKIMGTNNKINNVKCIYEALKNLEKPRFEKVKKEKSEKVEKEIKEVKKEETKK